MSIIDLGCGWGSVSIYLASKFPNCKITSVSNSHSQKVFILGRAAERGYKNISVYTGKKKFSGKNPSITHFAVYWSIYIVSSLLAVLKCVVRYSIIRYISSLLSRTRCITLNMFM